MSKSNVRKLLLSIAVVGGVTTVNYQVKADSSANLETYNKAREVYKTLSGKDNALPIGTSSMSESELHGHTMKILNEIETIECTKIAAASNKRDFMAEYHAIMEKLYDSKTSAKEADRLNFEIAKLEKEASKEGIHLGEGAEKQEIEKEAKKSKEDQMQALQDRKKEEESKDKAAYDSRADWQKDFANEPLVKRFKDDTTLYNSLINFRQAGEVVEEIRGESHENVLRALRYRAQHYLRVGKLSSSQQSTLSDIISKIQLRLDGLGVKTSAQTVQVGGFTAQPGDAEAYATLQKIWESKTGTVYDSLSKIRQTDALITFIVQPMSILRGKSFDLKMFNSISYGKATPLELRAFRYVLSQGNTSAISPTKMNEIMKNIETNINSFGKGTPNPQVKARADEENKFGTPTPRPAPPKGLLLRPLPADRGASASQPGVNPSAQSGGMNQLFDELRSGQRNLRKVEPPK